MVLHLGGGPHDTVRRYYTNDTSTHEFLDFLYKGRRCNDQYVTKFERTSKWENAVRMSHTDYGLMHPPAMSTNNDERGGGDLDLTEQTLANVTIRDRTPSTNPGELREKAPASSESSRGSVGGMNVLTPDTVIKMMASIDTMVNMLPDLSEKMNTLTQRVEREHEQVQAQFESLQQDFNTLRQENSESGLDPAGSMGSHGNTPNDVYQEEEGTHQSDSDTKDGGCRETEGKIEPTPEVKTFGSTSGVLDEHQTAAEDVNAPTFVSSPAPGDDDPGDDDESVKSRGSSKKRKQKPRKSLIPATTPDGGKDSTETDMLILSMTTTQLQNRKMKPFDHDKVIKLATKVFAEGSDNRAFPLDMLDQIIRVAGTGFTNFISAEEILCNFELVLDRNGITLRKGWGLEVDPLGTGVQDGSICSILDDSLNQASGSNYATYRQLLFKHGIESKTPEQHRTWLLEAHKFLKDEALNAGKSVTFVYIPPPKLAKLVEMYNADQLRVCETVLTLAKTIRDEQEQAPQSCFNGIGTVVNKLEQLINQSQTTRFISDPRARSTPADLLCGIKYVGYLAWQTLMQLCRTPVVMGSIEAKRLLLDVTSPESPLINPEGDGHMLADMLRTVVKRLEDCYSNPSHCLMLTEISKVKVFYAVMFTHFRNNTNPALQKYMSALQLAFGSSDGTNEMPDVLDQNTKNADRVYREITVDGKTIEIEDALFIAAPPKIKIDGRTLRTLNDHLDYVTLLSTSKLWIATNENPMSTQQLLESHDKNSSVNAAQSSKKSNRKKGKGGPWGVTQTWMGRPRNGTIGNEHANNKYTKAREMLLAKKENGNPRYPKQDWAIPALRKLTGAQADLLQKHTGMVWSKTAKTGNRSYILDNAREIKAQAFASDLKPETIVAYWIATNSWPMEMNSQAAPMHQKTKGKKKGTAAAADQSNNDEPTDDKEEDTEQSTSDRVVEQDEKDPNKLLIHTVNPSTQALVIEGKVVTLDDIRTAMERGDDDQSIGGADDSTWASKGNAIVRKH